MKIINTIDRYLASVEKILIVAIIFGMVALSCLQILLRNLFASGIPSADIILRYLTLNLAFFGASMATREGRHLKIDIIPRMVSGRFGQLIGLLTTGISVFVCLILARAGWSFVVLERESAALSVLDVPLWTAKLIIPIGFFLIAMRMVLKMVEQTHVLVSKTSASVPDEEGEAG
jgi:C4-dicarboxylate transporter DctQ subunit